MSYKDKYFHFDNYYWEKPQSYSAFTVYQIGDISCKSGFSTDAHVQPCYEISYILSGEGVFVLDKQKYSLQKGDVFLCLPGQRHNAIANEANPFRYLYLGFFFEKNTDFNSSLDYCENLFLNSETPVHQDNQHIEEPFLSLVRELYSPGEFSYPMIESYLRQVVLLTGRCFCQNIAKKENIAYNNELVYGVISYIDNKLFDIVSLADMAESLNYSYSYLSRVFTAATGMQIQSYYNKKRIAKAVELLAENMPVIDIAEKLHYQSIHSFGKAFKKAMGLSPAAYRNFMWEKT